MCRQPLPPSFSSPVKTSDNLEEFADELTLLDSFPPGNDDSVLKKGVHEENFQVYSNPLFEFDDNFNSSNENPLFNEMVEDVDNENSNFAHSDEPVLLNTPLSDKVKCSNPEVDIDEIDAFLAMEVSSNFEEGYYDSEGDVIFLENLLSDDTTHNLAPERIPREHEKYLSLMTLLCEISTSQSPENFPVSLIPIEDSDSVQEEIDIFLVLDDLIPLGVENDDSENEDNSTFPPENESSILEPSSPRPPPEPPDVCLNFKPDTAMKNDEDFNQGEIILSLNVEDVNSFTFVILIFLPFFTYPEDSLFILSLRSTDKAKNHKKTVKTGQKTNTGTEEHAKSREEAIKAKLWSNFSQLGQPKSRTKRTIQVLKYTLAATNVIHKLSLVNTLQDMPRRLVRKHKERDILHSFYTQKKHKKLQTTDCHADNPCELISDLTVKSEYLMIGLDQGPLLAGACN
ncbi:hypothetical protein Tco_0840126 [Tanacetum coccineum]|uniref:Uncharacterized protein n=1 Tax=Tanacetum coccineum TaxID=301880 RepID=A0ABQ5AXF2_9ASTR